MTDGNQEEPASPKTVPHYHGHRERLRARFRDAGVEAIRGRTDFDQIRQELAAAGE